MIKFVFFNFFISTVDVLLLYIITKSNTIKVIKPKKIKDKINFLLNDILIYLCIFLMLSVPILNIFILCIILQEIYNSMIIKIKMNN